MYGTNVKIIRLTFKNSTWCSHCI